MTVLPYASPRPDATRVELLPGATRLIVPSGAVLSEVLALIGGGTAVLLLGGLVSLAGMWFVADSRERCAAGCFLFTLGFVWLVVLMRFVDDLRWFQRWVTLDATPAGLQWQLSAGRRRREATFIPAAWIERIELVPIYRRLFGMPSVELRVRWSGDAPRADRRRLGRATRLPLPGTNLVQGARIVDQLTDALSPGGSITV